MGYTTDFSGRFLIQPHLTAEQTAYINAFAETRRIIRNPEAAELLADPVRVAAGLPIGEPDAAYFTGYGDDLNDPTAVDVNTPPGQVIQHEWVVPRFWDAPEDSAGNRRLSYQVVDAYNGYSLAETRVGTVEEAFAANTGRTRLIGDLCRLDHKHQTSESCVLGAVRERYWNADDVQPSLYCQWVTDGDTLFWDGREKFYGYVEWLRYLLRHFFGPWGRTLQGVVEFIGEDPTDRGVIRIEKGEPGSQVVEVQFINLPYQPTHWLP